jgi:hypothetical protein
MIGTMIELQQDIPAQIEYASDLGMDTLRFGLYPQTLADGLSKLDDNSELIKSKNMKVIIVLMNPGGGFVKKHWDIVKNTQTMRDFINMWVEISQKENGNDAVVAFELWNEPDISDYSKYLAIMQNTADEIRIYSQKKIYIMHGYGDPRNMRMMKPIKGENIGYSFHYYLDPDITHQGTKQYPRVGRKYSGSQNKVLTDLKYVLRFRDRYQVEVVNTELGCTIANKLNQINWSHDVLTVLKKNNIGWIWNNVMPMDGNPWALDLGTKILIKEMTNGD